MRCDPIACEFTCNDERCSRLHVGPRFKFLDQAVAWSEELNIYLILDNHSFDPAIDTQPEVQDILVKVWTQLAMHYKDSGPYLLYEILNEPHGISDVVWGAIQQSVIDGIRAHDLEHYIVVGGTNYNSYTALADLPVLRQAHLHIPLL